jgi:hypothetical protein
MGEVVENEEDTISINEAASLLAANQPFIDIPNTINWLGSCPSAVNNDSTSGDHSRGRAR